MAAPLTAGQAAYLQATRQIRVTWRDDSLPHQIRIFLHTASGGKIAVSCTCLASPARMKNGRAHPGILRYRPLDARTLWQPHEPMEVWRAHMAEVEAVS